LSAGSQTQAEIAAGGSPISARRKNLAQIGATPDDGRWAAKSHRSLHPFENHPLPKPEKGFFGEKTQDEGQKNFTAAEKISDFFYFALALWTNFYIILALEEREC
jgi:hypothetical protein